MKRKTITMILAILAFLIALGLTLYPMIAAKYNASHQSAIHADYEQILDKTDDAQKEQALELAHQYNEMLKPGVQEAFSQDLLQWASEDYADQLNIAGNGIMGYVVIPNIQVNLPIFHGTGMKVGDIFYLDILGLRLAYEVKEINTVLPYDTSLLEIEPEEDLCTLVTCTPYGVNTHRLLVRGVRISYEAPTEEELAEIEFVPVKSTWEQQYVKGLGVGILLVAVFGAVLLGVGFWSKRHG